MFCVAAQEREHVTPKAADVWTARPAPRARERAAFAARKAGSHRSGLEPCTKGRLYSEKSEPLFTRVSALQNSIALLKPLAIRLRNADLEPLRTLGLRMIDASVMPTSSLRCSVQGATLLVAATACCHESWVFFGGPFLYIGTSDPLPEANEIHRSAALPL